ncbi:MAG: MATE family efflux transporter [Saprospiraceae bacterium]
MHLNTSYRQIFSISAPIMLGTAAQNVIALSDSIFLFHRSELDFAAIGFVSVFYLIVAAIGYGFSKGGQIIIARRAGEEDYKEVGHTFYAMLYFELVLAIGLFFFMQYGCTYFFTLFVDSKEILDKSIAYLNYRSWGVFFSYTGLAMIAFYTGIARTKFILIDTCILGIVNIVLNYGLIYGRFGLPEMGIAGAGLASTIAEIVAFVVFIVYVYFDKGIKKYKLFKIPKIDWQLIRDQQRLASPIVAQSIVGLGSWFVFFGIVENLGERPLAITNLVRMVFLFLQIPSWGFASTINTLVSHFIGQQKRQAVVPIIWKTAKFSWFITMLLTIPMVLFPTQILYPLLGSADMSLITEAQPIFYVLMVILTLNSIGVVYFNGLAGVGATYYGLKIQTWCAVGYLAYIYAVINFFEGGLVLAWTAEIVYWAIMLVLMIWYLKSNVWYKLKV